MIKVLQMEAIVSALEKRRGLVEAYSRQEHKPQDEMKAAWDSVAAEVNERGVFRKFLTGSDVKGKWADLKYRTRKKAGLLELGPDNPNPNLSTLDMRILSLIGVTRSVEPDKKESSEDSDSINRCCESPLSQRLSAQDSDASEAYQSQDTEALNAENKGALRSPNPEGLNSVTIRQATDNEESSPKCMSSRVRLFMNKRKNKNSILKRLLQLEERKVELKEQKIKQLTRIANFEEEKVRQLTRIANFFT